MMRFIKYSWSWLALDVIILVIIITAVILSTDELEASAKNVEEHVFFAKWHAYIGYALYEKNGKIQLPFLDEHPNYKQFSGEIKEVSLNFTYDDEIYMPTNLRKSQNPISLSGFEVLGGNKIASGKYSLRTLQIPFHIEKEGIVKFDELTVIMSDGRTYTWQVGNWEIEIKKMLKYDDFEQGDRGFVIDPVPKYYFEMINKSLDVLNCDRLIYGENIQNKLQIDISQSEPKIESGFTEMMVYCEDGWVLSEDAFYYIKPFLQYDIGDKEKIAPLEDVDFSGLFTVDAVKQILKNKGIKE